MRDVKKFQFRLGFLAVAALALTACGAGTESGGADGDGRNTALAGDNGLPFAGYSPNIGRIAIDPQTGAPWVSSSLSIGIPAPIGVGVVTGGAARVTPGATWMLDASFPRVNGRVSTIVTHPQTGDTYLGGDITGAGTAQGLGSLAVVGRDGTVRTNPDIRFNGMVSTLVARGGFIHVGGAFSSANWSTGGGSLNRTGYAVIRASDRKLLDPMPLEGFAPGTATVDDIAFAGDDSLRALVTVRSGTPFTWSVRAYDLATGRRIPGIPVLASDTRRIELVDVGNGIAAFRSLATAPNTVNFFDFKENRVVGTYVVPANMTLQSMIRADRVLRLMALIDNGWHFIDVNPATRQLSKFYNRQDYAGWSGPAPREMVWANADNTLTDVGWLYSTTSTLGPLALAASRAVATDTNGSLSTAASSGDKVILGGYFSTMGNTAFDFTTRLPGDGKVGTDAEPLAGFWNDVLTSTPHGVVVRSGTSLLLYANGPTQPPKVIATARPSTTGSCFYVFNDAEWHDGRLYVAGCWDNVTVGSETVFNGALSIEQLGEVPQIGRLFPVGAGLQIAAAGALVMTVSVTQIGNKTISLFDRDPSGVVRWSTDATGEIYDLVGFPIDGTRHAHFLIGGWTMSIAGINRGALALLRPTVVGAPPVTSMDWMPLPARALSYDAANNRVLIAGESTFGGVRRTLLALRTPLLDVAVGPVVVTNDVIHDVEVKDNAVHIGGAFQTMTVNGTTYRSSGIAGFSNWTGAAVVTRPETPIVDQPAAPRDSNSGNGGGAPASNEGDDAPIGNPAEQLPPLPANGTPQEGLFKVVDDAGNATTVVVDKNGTVTLSPPTSSARPTISRLAPGSRTMKVSWGALFGTDSYTVKTCRTTKTSCTVKKLDPWRAWTFTVEAKDGRVVTSSDVSPALKPFVSVKKGKSPNLRDIVKPGAKGKASWRVNGACKVAGTKLTTPKRATRCTVTVKAGTSTRTVSVRVG